MLRLRIAELVGGHEHRAHRAGSVEALALEPLAVPLLQVAAGDVVQHRIAEHVRQRVARPDIAARPADDHGELRFPVELLRHRGVMRHVVEGAVHRRRRLGEELRHVGQLHLAVVGRGALADVRRIVAADAEDVLRRPRNRRMKAHVGERMAGPARDRCRTVADDVEQAGGRQFDDAIAVDDPGTRT
ncbi:hypothetical protein D3C83_06570 [compost metagenome]